MTRLDSLGRRNNGGRPHDVLEVWTRHGSGPRIWGVHGACRRHDPELFFVADKPRSGRYSREQITAIQNAKSICTSCPVIEQCLTHALRVDEEGIWGGLTKRERDDLKKGGTHHG